MATKTSSAREMEDLQKQNADLVVKFKQKTMKFHFGNFHFYLLNNYT